MENSMAGAIAGSAARSLIDGSSFGDNLIAALPDVIGSTIGTIVAGVAASSMTRRSSQVAISAESEMWPAALGIGPSFEHRPLMLFRGADADQESWSDWMHRRTSSISDTITTTVGEWIDNGEDIVVTAKKTANNVYDNSVNLWNTLDYQIQKLTQAISRMDARIDAEISRAWDRQVTRLTDGNKYALGSRMVAGYLNRNGPTMLGNHVEAMAGGTAGW